MLNNDLKKEKKKKSNVKITYTQHIPNNNFAKIVPLTSSSSAIAVVNDESYFYYFFFIPCISRRGERNRVRGDFQLSFMLYAFLRGTLSSLISRFTALRSPFVVHGDNVFCKFRDFVWSRPTFNTFVAYDLSRICVSTYLFLLFLFSFFFLSFFFYVMHMTVIVIQLWN